MSASSQNQPLNKLEILPSEWLLLERSGHSPLGAASGWFRPEVAGQIKDSSLVASVLALDCELLDRFPKYSMIGPYHRLGQHFFHMGLQFVRELVVAKFPVAFEAGGLHRDTY